MPTGIAEYLGQRTDVAAPLIRPSALNPAVVPTCHFSGGPCCKLKGKKSYPPVCSVRSTDGSLFVVCSDRVVPASSTRITPEHLRLLGEVSARLFPGARDELVGFKRQTGVRTSDGALYLDYVLYVNDSQYFGPRSAILEIQGGGETSNTGTLSRHVEEWSRDPARTNAGLGQKFSGVGLIPDNAWKRQLWQILQKTPIAKSFGGGFAIVLGPGLFDYVRTKVHTGRSWYPEWEVAFVEVCEVPGGGSGPVPLTVDRSIFMTFQEFVDSVSNIEVQGVVRNPFEGVFTTLVNEQFTVDGSVGQR